MRSGVAHGIARGWGAACILVLPTLLLGSCMTPPAETGATADFFAVIDATQDLAGGQWDVQDDPTSRGCVLPDGTEGETFSALRISVMPAVVLNSVAAAWEDYGYSVDRESIGPVNQLVATNSTSEVLIFRVSDRAMTLQGESECQPSE